jgi:hypothetical protein
MRSDAIWQTLKQLFVDFRFVIRPTLIDANKNKPECHNVLMFPRVGQWLKIDTASTDRQSMVTVNLMSRHLWNTTSVQDDDVQIQIFRTFRPSNLDVRVIRLCRNHLLTILPHIIAPVHICRQQLLAPTLAGRRLRRGNSLLASIFRYYSLQAYMCQHLWT